MSGVVNEKYFSLLSSFKKVSGFREEQVASKTRKHRDRIILRGIIKEMEFDDVNCLRPIHDRNMGTRVQSQFL
jgi:hypothetical protein